MGGGDADGYQEKAKHQSLRFCKKERRKPGVLARLVGAKDKKKRDRFSKKQ